MRVLAGDIGGTNCRLQIADVMDGQVRVVHSGRYVNAKFSSFGDVVGEFLNRSTLAAETGVAAACFAVAGPIDSSGSEQRVRVTNCPWELDNADLRRRFSISALRFVNDLEAVGHGIPLLPRSAFSVLQQGERQHRGVCAVIGVGTGLGLALMMPAEGGQHVIPTEGGHIDFAPLDEEQVLLWRFLVTRYGRATYERVLSGPGLSDLYAWLSHRTAGNGGVEQASMTRVDPAFVTSSAMRENDATAIQALDVFSKVCGAFAGNVALSSLAHGGIYLAGGIPPRLVEKLSDGQFLRAFQDKGRMQPLLRRVPISIVMDDSVGLKGATVVASRLVASGG